ncbi:maleylacetoacetate isomerase [Marinomonas algicola]|uniref:maleylacetoacetate isomerase n=1 Tax=Marinomonas algicola TaxID=2773454 RepID=UPI001749358C|nr:maleylacetoacetate isomerase [Marinomonas algicola]
MQLYNFFNSSTSYRVRIALALKGLDYQHHGVNIRIGEQSSISHKKLNPAKGVPVLITNDGEKLTQSMAILDYLEQTYPDVPLLPTETLVRARVLEVANLIACDMHPVNNLRILAYLKQQLDVSEEQKAQWYKHWVQESFTALESLLNEYGHGTYCFGTHPTLADCCLVPQVANALRFGCDLSAFTKILSIYDYCQQQAEFQKAAPSQQPDFIN